MKYVLSGSLFVAGVIEVDLDEQTGDVYTRVMPNKEPVHFSQFTVVGPAGQQTESVAGALRLFAGHRLAGCAMESFKAEMKSRAGVGPIGVLAPKPGQAPS